MRAMNDFLFCPDRLHSVRSGRFTDARSFIPTFKLLSVAGPEIRPYFTLETLESLGDHVLGPVCSVLGLNAPGRLVLDKWNWVRPEQPRETDASPLPLNEGLGTADLLGLPSVPPVGMESANN